MIVGMTVPVTMAVRVIVTTSASIPVGMRIMVMAGVFMGIGSGLRLERTCDMGNLAALPAHHFGQHVIVLNIDRIRGNFGWRMPITDMPCHFQKPQGIIRLDFQQGFGRGFDQNQPAVIEFQRIAIIENGCFFKIEQEGCTLFSIEHHAAFMPAVMIERDLIDHTLDFNRRFAKDGR